MRTAGCRDAPLKPLIQRRSFIRSKAHRAVAVRFGYIKVPEVDSALIAAAMKPMPSSANAA
jgi:hypothetical protein